MQINAFYQGVPIRRMPLKILLIMKLIMVMMTLLLVQVQAGVLAQQVSLNEKNTSLQKVIDKIREQCGYDFLVLDYDLIRDARPVTIQLDKTNLGDALDKILLPRGLEYSLEDNSIVIKEKATLPTSVYPLDRTAMQQEPVRGRVVDEQGEPLAGATVYVLDSEGRRTGVQALSDDDGNFQLLGIAEEVSLEITYLGYAPRRLIARSQMGMIALEPSASGLEEVEVMVHTGYQSIPKERATGSFTHIDNKMLNRSVGTDIIARLEGITSGLQFHRQGATGENNENYTIQVRGRATIMSEESPLIVLDNFPFEGNLEDINPNDIESVTILKDAAAASIWGARAGNGVIVINSKTGEYGSRANISYSGNWSFVEKPDLFFNRTDFDSPTLMRIQKEKYDFGRYNTQLGANQWYVPPYVELLDQYAKGEITETDFLAQEAWLKASDIRHDITKYLYQTAVKQQQALSVGGGSETNKYYFSAGYNGDQAGMVGNSSRQLTLNLQNTFRPIKALELTAKVGYNLSEAAQNASSFTRIRGASSERLITNWRLVDDDGRHLPYPQPTWRQSFRDGMEALGGVNWSYYPIQETELADNTSKSNYLMLHGAASYSLPFGLSAQGVYQYSRTNSNSLNYYAPESFFVRDLVNKYLQTNGTRPIPHAGILDGGASGEQHSHSGRFQLNYNRRFSADHDVAAIAGGEARQVNSYSLPGFRLYDYHDDLGMGSTYFDYTKSYSNVMGQNAGTVPGASTAVNLYNTIDRYLSYFANASYSYQKKYVLSGSVRWDGSNLFGVKTNQKGTPLWSVGGSWNIDQEPFYQVEALSKLKVRATYGSSGNVNKSISTFPVIRYSISSGVDAGLPRIAHLRSPGNPSLRWERVNTFNIATEFTFKNNRVDGGIEYFVKNANDLLGEAYLPPSTGVNGHNTYLTSYTFNYASLRTQGLDVFVNSRNLTGVVKWDTRVLVSYAKDKVTAYYNDDNAVANNYFNALKPLIVGRPLNTVYAYKWHGLDGETGKVLAYIDGEKTTDYRAYRDQVKPEDLVIAGVSEAPWYGSMLNAFRWNNVQLSFLVSWSAGAVYRRGSIFPGREYENTNAYFHRDLLKKWQKPGDEKHTYVPKGGDLQNKFDNFELQVYTNSEVLISKRDYIALQDVTLSYNFAKRRLSTYTVPAFEVYVYSKNLGYLWKADKSGTDPITPGTFYPRQRNVALGIRVGF